MAAKNPGDKWIAISYDGKLTGSLEHRCYNHTKMVKFLKDTPPDELSPIGMYAKAYDVTAGKSKEPNFDGIMAYIALMDDDIFNGHFHYLSVEYEDKPIIDALRSGLSTCVTGMAGTREMFQQFNVKGGYRGFKHVFILGPISPSVVRYMNILSGNIIFHFQGEPPCMKNPELSTTAYPDHMTATDGLFPAPFNFWTGETEAMTVRSFMDHKFTVKCHGAVVKDIEMYEVRPPLPPPSEPQPTLKLDYPAIFVEIQDCILKNEYLHNGDESGMVAIPLIRERLDIGCIAEDLIDKDNATACAILLKHSVDPPALLLIGRRVYNAGDGGPNFRKYHFKPLGARPDLTAESETLTPPIQQSNWIWMAPCVGDTEVQFPGLQADSGMVVNQSLNVELTMDYHTNAAILFKELLDASKCDGLYRLKPTDESDIVDGMGPSSTSMRSPFHEKMVACVGIIGVAMEYAKRGIVGEAMTAAIAGMASTGGTRRKRKSRKRNQSR